MSETYSIEFKNLEADMKKRHFEKIKKDAQHILQTIPLEKAEILGEAMGFMEYEMNTAKDLGTKGYKLADNLLTDYTAMKKHAEMLEWFIRDIQRLYDRGLSMAFKNETGKVLEEYKEYREKRNKDQLNK